MVKTFKRIGGFIRAAQYVLILIFAFTVTWLPALCGLFLDAFRDYIIGHGYEAQCGRLTEEEPLSNNQTESLADIQIMILRAIHISNGASIQSQVRDIQVGKGGVWGLSP